MFKDYIEGIGSLTSCPGPGVGNPFQWAMALIWQRFLSVNLTPFHWRVRQPLPPLYTSFKTLRYPAVFIFGQAEHHCPIDIMPVRDT